MPRKPLTKVEIDSFRTSYCETAYALYQQEDYDAVTMRGIAKVMGCSPMMAYRYFDNKEAVFASLRAILFPGRRRSKGRGFTGYTWFRRSREP